MPLTRDTLRPADVLGGIVDPCFATDADGRIVWVNAAAAAVQDRAPDAVLGTSLHETWAGSPDAPFIRAVRDVLASAGTRRFEQAFVGRWFAGTVAAIPGGAVVTFTDVTAAREAERRAAWLASREAALRRVAEAVARAATPTEVMTLVAQEAVSLTGAHASAVLRFEDGDDRSVTVMGAWRARIDPPYRPGEALVLSPDSAVLPVRRTGVVSTEEHLPPKTTSAWGRMGCRAQVVAPIHALGRLWGCVSLGWLEPVLLPHAAEELSRFTDVASLAVDVAAGRESLAEQASRDPLTGLLNHRHFHDRLRLECDRAARYERPLSLVLVDLDAFKTINDALGHQTGDAVLREVAERLRAGTREFDVLGRVGGDELAVLMPETTGEAALAVVERARADVGELAVAGRPVTLSAGVCDARHADGPLDLFRLADGALYWAKAHGRDAACLYDPAVVRELSAGERADHLERSHALLGLRGLARAIDAKDPGTRRHSDRVAILAERLALELGWDRERAARLRETAQLHDVGKIGVPDAVLRKPGRLTPEEYETVKAHAALGADIVAELLPTEQCAWVRHHHERPDGSGYPDGLAGEAIPDGARVIAVADAFDVMTAARPYASPKPVGAAVDEVRRLAGAQFDAAVAQALVALQDRGALRP